MNATRVLLADDHAPVCADIRVLLEKLSGMDLVGEVGNGREALNLNASRDTSAITSGGLRCWAAGLRLALLLLALVPPGAVAQGNVETPRTIRVVVDNNYAPFSFQSDEGKLEGILIDQWQAWERKTGIKVEMRAMDWGEALRSVRAREFDVIDCIVETAERRRYFDFTPAYATIEASIFFRREISGIADIASLKGFPVGAKAGDQHIDKLKTNGVTSEILFQNYGAMIAAAKQHKINVFVADAPSALYLLNKKGIEAEFRHSAPIFRDELRRAVRKGDTSLLRTVSEGFTAIEPGELKQIDEKWFGHSINRIGAYLTYAGYAAGLAILLVAGLVGWNRTLRKRILQRTAALGESEQRFRQIAENINEVFWLSNPEATLIHYVSPAYEKIWGRSCDRLYAEPTSWMDPIHPGDRERVAEAIRSQSISGQHDLTYRIVRPDGSLRWIRDRAFPVSDKSGKLIRVAGIAEDMTERMEAQERLRLSETKFRRLLASNITGVVFWTLEGDILDANDLFLDMVGYSREDLREGTLSWKKLTPREYAPVDEKAIGELTATGTCAPFEKEYIRKDGRRVAVLIGSALLEPKKDAGSSFVVDITERRRVELALDERLRFETLLTELSAAFANLPATAVDQEIDKWLQNLVEFLDLDRAIFDQVEEDGITLLRTHSHTARGIDTRPLNVANNQAPWITEQLLRGNTVKWSRIPDDIPEQAAKEKEFASRIGAKSVLSIPVCIGGAVICAISFTSMRIYRDWPDEMVARLRLVGEIFANAVARKRAEEILFRREAELNEAQRLASIGSWEWDILADVVTCSSVVRRIYGFEREDQNSPNRAFSEFVHPDDQARRSAAVDAALKGGPPYDVEFRIIRPDKSVRFAHSRGRLIYDDAGQPVRMLGMTQDITERKRAAKQLEEANYQLRLLSRRLFDAQEEERRHLARELHDEIGQTLTAAKINLQSVTANGGEATSARLQETTAILDRLLGQVRKISLDLRPLMLDDLGLVPALRSLLDQQGRRASVPVRFSADNIPENLDPEIQTTCFRIAQEAITNVLRHARATNVEVDLRRQNGKFRFLIRDNGLGFDAGSAQAQTVGLGLIGIKERAALIGGRAKIISSPNKGTTIEVFLPLTLRSERQGHLQ
jgi:PAS domain S-box-containing protein